MTKEAVAKEFLLDFLENLGDYEYDPHEGLGEEESKIILADLFFGGLLKLRWDPKKHSLILEMLERSPRVN